MTVKDLEDEVLKKTLNMVAPDVILDGKGTVIISSEEGETEENNPKKLGVSELWCRQIVILYHIYQER
jgi:ubiquitin-like 1-activating enzyme E1 B